MKLCDDLSLEIKVSIAARPAAPARVDGDEDSWGAEKGSSAYLLQGGQVLDASLRPRCEQVKCTSHTIGVQTLREVDDTHRMGHNTIVER